MTPNGAYGNMAAQAPYRPAMPINLQGRVVASVDEGIASQVPLDGSVSYFPSPGEGKIYYYNRNSEEWKEDGEKA